MHYGYCICFLESSKYGTCTIWWEQLHLCSEVCHGETTAFPVQYHYPQDNGDPCAVRCVMGKQLHSLYNITILRTMGTPVQWDVSWGNNCIPCTISLSSEQWGPLCSEMCHGETTAFAIQHVLFRAGSCGNDPTAAICATWSGVPSFLPKAKGGNSPLEVIYQNSPTFGLRVRDFILVDA